MTRDHCATPKDTTYALPNDVAASRRVALLLLSARKACWLVIFLLRELRATDRILTLTTDGLDNVRAVIASRLFFFAVGDKVFNR